GIGNTGVAQLGLEGGDEIGGSAHGGRRCGDDDAYRIAGDPLPCSTTTPGIVWRYHPSFYSLRPGHSGSCASRGDGRGEPIDTLKGTSNNARFSVNPAAQR